MRKGYSTFLGMAVALLAGIALIPQPAAAQSEQQDHYTYVSEWAVPRAQWGAFEKEDASEIPMLKQLVANGTLIAWGEDATRVHQLDGYTHSDWFIATSRANLLKALEEIWKNATNASFVATTKHQDLFLHTIAHGGKSASDATGYLRVGFYHAKPGDADALQALLLQDVKPMLDAGVADGTLLMYNIDEEDIHTEAPGAFNMALLFPNGEAMDKFFANLSASFKANPGPAQIFDSLVVMKDHRDDLDYVSAYEHK